jgi:RNA polymerase primary sigma factor
MDFNDKDSMSSYFKMVKRYPVLNHEEIIELFKQFETAKNSKNTILQKQLKDKIVSHNLRFVIYMAKRFRKSHPMSELDDLITCGNIGLMRAVERYDRTLGIKFTSYATYWINSHMYNSNRETGSIFIPYHIQDLIIRKKKLVNDFVIEHARDPTDAEIMDLLRVSQERMDFINDAESKCSSNIISLDMPAYSGEDNDLSIVDNFHDPNDNISPSDRLYSKEIGELINKLLADFPKRDAEIFILRHGLNNKSRMALEAIGDMYHISRERVRQIQKKITNKLRKNAELLKFTHNI